MALKNRNKRRVRPGEKGMSLIELMIAMIVLLVGLVGSMSLVALSVGGNGRNRQQSNSIAISQMVTEKISSVKATTNPNLAITDCTGTSYTVSTAGPAGGALTSSGDVDFSQAQVANYSMYYTACGTSGRQMVYDVRWTIATPSGYVKLVTVSTRLKNPGNSRIGFSLPVTIRTLIGQGT
jgi:prepilin-type N-terminal cleavage/methylation domain-containing protein